MKIVIQKVKEARVEVDHNIIGKIGLGYLLLVGFEISDNLLDVEKAANKISTIRLFNDDVGKINLSITDVKGSILSVSQFTLSANIQKGNRPSFVEAMNPEAANQYFNRFNDLLRDNGLKVETGQFQADMEVSLINDGPVTIIMNVKDGKVL